MTTDQNSAQADNSLDTARLQRIQAASLQDQTMSHSCIQTGADEALEDHSLFRHVMEASQTFVERFGGHLTQQGAWAKADEEYREFKDALRLLAKQRTDDTVREAAGELIDTLVTLGGMAAEAGITWSDIESAALKTLAKLDNRTRECYEWREDVQQVVRKGRDR